MNRPRVIETVVTHGWGALTFVDATTGRTDDLASRLPIDEVPHVELRNAPRGLVTIRKRAVLALSFEEGSVLEGDASGEIPEFLAPPEREPLALSGVVRGSTERWLPRAFALSLQRGERASIELFPSPFGVQVGTGGALIARLGKLSGEPVPWAIVTLSVEVPPDTIIVCRGQSDARGDLVLPMRRVPPLPKGVDDYAATLSVRFKPDADPELPLDPSELVPGKLVGPDSPAEAAAIALRVRPGVRQRISSYDNDSRQLVVKP